MAAFAEGLFTLLGRLLLTAIFLGSAVHKFQSPDATKGAIKAVGMLDAANSLKEHDRNIDVLYWGAIALLGVGGLSVLIGYKARIGAVLLLVFLGVATWFFHNPLRHQDATDEKKQSEQIQLLKNAGLAGGALLILARGAGRWSLDSNDRDDDE